MLIPKILRRRRKREVWGAKTTSMLMSDIDMVWKSSDLPVGDGPNLLSNVAWMSPEYAAAALHQKLPPSQRNGDLPERLRGVGIALGVLTPNTAVRSGVYAMWRSALPVLLVEEQAVPGPLLSKEIAVQVGHLVFGERLSETGEPEAQVFAESFESELQRESLKNEDHGA